MTPRTGPRIGSSRKGAFAAGLAVVLGLFAVGFAAGILKPATFGLAAVETIQDVEDDDEDSLPAEDEDGEAKEDDEENEDDEDDSEEDEEPVVIVTPKPRVP